MTNDATINELVAEHVLGMKQTSLGTLRIARAWPNEHGGYGPPPDACNDGNVMLRVIDVMQRRGFVVTIRTFPMTITIGTVSYSWDAHAALAPNNLPRAVALAALKALGIEVPTWPCACGRLPEECYDCNDGEAT